MFGPYLVVFTIMEIVFQRTNSDLNVGSDRFSMFEILAKNAKLDIKSLYLSHQETDFAIVGACST
jgi:hypothetical protein